MSQLSWSRPDDSFLPVLLAIGLAAVHLFAGNLRGFRVIPRSSWLSLAGGASVSYVFVHIFPELNYHQRAFEQMGASLVGFFEHHVYLVALVGFAVFYGLERFAITSRQQNRQNKGGDVTSPRAAILHIASFALYNALIGYLLVHQQLSGSGELILFSVAIALHFVVNDYGLRVHHKTAYDRIGRWLLAAAVILGWGVGQLTSIHDAAIATLFAFLSGGIILNVLKEELPEERESRFWAFGLGAILYTLLLIDY
ncbi:hypothetical protein IQ268_22255 [Oculatella sp. LEGE 06141]|nr:hypothetical protein [Oculatella sp. LEGE 06141]